MIIRVPRDLFFFNVGETTKEWRRNFDPPFANRNWDNCRKFGFMSAGQGLNWSKQITRLKNGDVFVAYVSEQGYVGIGKVIDTGRRAILEFTLHSNYALNNVQNQFYNTRKVFEHNSKIITEDYPSNIFLNGPNPDLCEYCLNVSWFSDNENGERTRDRTATPTQMPFWKAGLFSPRHIVCSLNNQRDTIQFIEQKFDVKFQQFNPINNLWENII